MVTKLAYIFPGQGAQYVGMGKDVYEAYPAAREIFDSANSILGFSLTGLCFNGPEEELSTTSNSQPAILATSIAFLRAIESVIEKIRPSVSLGLSLGEYSALVAAGSLEFSDALRLVYSRGRFMEESSRQNPGKMASIIGLELGKIEEICKTTNSEIANLNCPGQVVISGRNESIEKATVLAKEGGAKRAIVLDVSGPFHSSLMTDASGKLEAVLRDVKIVPPSVPVISNVGASEEGSEDEIKQNLTYQVNHRTFWEKSIRGVVESGISSFLEIGPGKVLKGLMRRIDPGLKVYNVGTVKEVEELVNAFTG